MEKQEFYARVRERSGFDQSDAEFVTQASITVLGRALPKEFAEELAGVLPEGLADFVEAVVETDPPPSWDEQEFWRQVSVRCAISDPRRVRAGFWAVIDVLREVAGDERVQRWVQALPAGVTREVEER